MAGDLLVINADGPETRVALIEKGQLGELYIERRRERGIVGNIYKGAGQARAARACRRRSSTSAWRRRRSSTSPTCAARPRTSSRCSSTTTTTRDATITKRASGSRGAHRGPGQGGPGDHGPGRQGADRHQGRALDRVRVAAGAQPGVHADRRPRRHLAAHRHGQGAQAAARASSIACGRRARASSCAPSPRASARRSCGPTWSSSSSCGTRSWPRSKTAPRRRRCSTTISICCCARCATCSRREVDKLIVDNKSEYERLLKFVGAFMPRLRRQDRALRRARADLRRLRHRGRDRSRARAQGLAASRAARSSSIRARRSPRSTSTPASSSASATSRRRSPRPTSRRARRSPTSCGCATSAA